MEGPAYDYLVIGGGSAGCVLAAARAVSTSTAKETVT
jgi:choline dehydrogenase-like flavoprotein